LARPRVLQEWDAERAERRLGAKRAELDSLAAAGWSVDSLATLWGGFERVTDIAPGRGLPTLGGRIAVDSLAFGGAAPPLAMGVVSDWVNLGRALTRIRVIGRRTPPADVVQNHLDRERRFALERAFLGYFDRLKGRYPVHIHDRELSETALPLPPPPS
jgi:hypothetical protein